MPYAKTSERAEQRALRERMRALGLSHPQIAFEFARRYNMRPRAAWRHARGWSLKQAAERITACAAQAGVDPHGATVAMTGPHLCEVESWPGYGPAPAGRRPTPYLLSLLATAYDCAIADLLDLADYEHLRPADLLVLGKTADTRGRRRASAGAGQAAPRAWPRSLNRALRGDRTSAAQLLLEADQAAPEEVGRNPHARALAESLATADPVRSQAVRELAARMNGHAGQPAPGRAPATGRQQRKVLYVIACGGRPATTPPSRRPSS